MEAHLLDAVEKELGSFRDPIYRHNDAFHLDRIRSTYETVRPAELLESLITQGVCSFPDIGLLQKQVHLKCYHDDIEEREEITFSESQGNLQPADGQITLKM